VSDYYYGSYIGPVEVLFGRCAMVHPCEDNPKELDDVKMITAQFDLPVQHPLSRVHLNHGWHRFREADFQRFKPLPE
jgi:hypothetical protein